MIALRIVLGCLGVAIMALGLVLFAWAWVPFVWALRPVRLSIARRSDLTALGMFLALVGGGLFVEAFPGPSQAAGGAICMTSMGAIFSLLLRFVVAWRLRWDKRRWQRLPPSWQRIEAFGISQEMMKRFYDIE